MQAPIKSRASVPGNKIRMEVRTLTGQWLQPQAVKMQPVFAFYRTASSFNHITPLSTVGYILSPAKMQCTDYLEFVAYLPQVTIRSGP